MRIDSHQHFWRYDPVEHNWMTEVMGAVKRDFVPEDLRPLLTSHKIDGTVLVQVSQTNEETVSLLRFADAFDFIKGVVGWIDLTSKDILRQLDAYRSFEKLKGFRHILQSEQPEFMLQQDFLNGIRALKEFDFTYDILVYPHHLPAAITLVEECPGQMFVLDHLAKPLIKEQKAGLWKQDIATLASHPNVYCKISGMVTEADWGRWKYEDFVPWLDVIVDRFGTDRIMFGSDWPMCLVAGSYQDVIKIAERYFGVFSNSDNELFFGGNAARFYKL